jgi:Ni/Co efflux regulator RcnB
MKRFAIAATAALMLVGPMAGVASAQRRPDLGAEPRYQRDRDNDRYDRRDDRRDRRDDRRRERWNDRNHNGYYLNGRWHYGPPPASVYNRSDYRPGRHAWRRGERLPSYYRTHYREVDWRRNHYRQPPRGYHYVRDDNTGEILLVAIATGVILSILMNQ